MTICTELSESTLIDTYPNYYMMEKTLNYGHRFRKCLNVNLQNHTISRRHAKLYHYLHAYKMRIWEVAELSFTVIIKNAQ